MKVGSSAVGSAVGGMTVSYTVEGLELPELRARSLWETTVLVVVAAFVRRLDP